MQAVNEDVQSIESIVRGYFDSFAMKDESWMESLVHPDLAKRHLVANPDGSQRIEQMSALKLIQNSRSYGKGSIPENARREVRVIDVYGNIATAIGLSESFVDYLHLAKINGTWQIVNVLWAFQEK
jgi:hypothetical protein